MRALLQRVKASRVEIEGTIAGQIEEGLMILLGVQEGDTPKHAEFLASKAANLRIFSDEEGKMNLSLLDKGFGALVVSNFTLAADCKKGRRPSFVKAGDPHIANGLYEHFVSQLKALGVKQVPTGQFGADMQVFIQNDGPVTILLDTDEIM